mmetsp:Transcript_3978/g.9596  ORF Transcript_3978/g.9596 Transcript_3978/m.9596 type:complete len:237 (-) Transcript_3978:50-760(-)
MTSRKVFGAQFWRSQTNEHVRNKTRIRHISLINVPSRRNINRNYLHRVVCLLHFLELLEDRGKWFAWLPLETEAEYGVHNGIIRIHVGWHFVQHGYTNVFALFDKIDKVLFLGLFWIYNRTIVSKKVQMSSRYQPVSSIVARSADDEDFSPWCTDAPFLWYSLVNGLGNGQSREFHELFQRKTRSGHELSIESCRIYGVEIPGTSHEGRCFTGRSFCFRGCLRTRGHREQCRGCVG